MPIGSKILIGCQKKCWVSNVAISGCLLYLPKKIVLLEFKRTSDCGESYYEEMWKVEDKQHAPILTGLRALAGERGWEVEVVPLVAGQRSVREKE